MMYTNVRMHWQNPPPCLHTKHSIDSAAVVEVLFWLCCFDRVFAAIVNSIGWNIKHSVPVPLSRSRSQPPPPHLVFPTPHPLFLGAFYVFLIFHFSSFLFLFLSFLCFSLFFIFLMVFYFSLFPFIFLLFLCFSFLFFSWFSLRFFILLHFLYFSLLFFTFFIFHYFLGALFSKPYFLEHPKLCFSGPPPYSLFHRGPFFSTHHTQCCFPGVLFFKTLSNSTQKPWPRPQLRSNYGRAAAIAKKTNLWWKCNCSIIFQWYEVRKAVFFIFDSVSLTILFKNLTKEKMYFSKCFSKNISIFIYFLSYRISLLLIALLWLALTKWNCLLLHYSTTQSLHGP